MHHKLRLESPIWEQLWTQAGPGQPGEDYKVIMSRPKAGGIYGAERGRDEGMTATRICEGRHDLFKTEDHNKVDKSIASTLANGGNTEVEKRCQARTKQPVQNRQRGHTGRQESRPATSCHFSCFLSSWFGRRWMKWPPTTHGYQVNGSVSHCKRPTSGPSLHVVRAPLFFALQIVVLPHQHDSQQRCPIASRGVYSAAQQTWSKTTPRFSIVHRRCLWADCRPHLLAGRP